MDLYKDKSNINSPQYIQSINFDKTKLKTIIVNTQKCVYDLKIAEINERIQRLEEQNRELESNLEGMDCFIKTLQEEKTKEISDLKSQIVSYSIRIRAYKHQLIILEKARINDKFTHTAITINSDEKYKNMGLMLTSQIKLLSAKTNILEDYKSTQHILEKKLDMRSQSLINEKGQVAENLCKIEYKFRIDRKRLKKELYNRLLELVSTFQHEVSRYMSHPIPNLLSENTAVKNQLLMITDSASSKTQDYILHTNAIKYKKKINMYLRTTKFIVISELEKSTIKMLHDIRKEANVNLSKLFKFHYFTEEQYITNKDNAKILARKCETRMKYVKLLLYCEKEKLTIAENQKRWISDQLQEQLQILYDVIYVLKNFKMKNKQS